MDTIQAFALGQANQGNEQKVFDWLQAARIIAEKNPQKAIAGLSSDMEWTAGTIWRDGSIVVDDYTFLASVWATPVLEIDGEEIPCYKMESETPGWGSETKWPIEAKEELQKLGVGNVS